MRDPIMERGGTGEDYPTILVAAQRATYDTARAKRGWTLTKGAVRYLLGPGREPTFKFDSLRVTTLRETRSDEHTSELQSRLHLVCRLLLEKKNPKSASSSLPSCYLSTAGTPTPRYLARCRHPLLL